MRQPIGQLTASLAILSLVIEQPDSVGNLYERLEQRYHHARWVRTTGYHDVAKLERAGYLRARGEDGGAVRRVVEITEKGRAAFADRLRRATQRPAPIRDPLHPLLEHIGEDELPRLLASLNRRLAHAEEGRERSEIALDTDAALTNPAAWGARRLVLEDLLLLHEHHVERIECLIASLNTIIARD